MKRSGSIKLVLLGSAGALALGAYLVASGGNDSLAQNDFFRDESECAGKNNPDSCRQALQDARAQHQKTAPAFASREACEVRFGVANCEPTVSRPAQEQIAAGDGRAVADATPSGTPASGIAQGVSQGGGSWFLPVMMGYMMGRAGGTGLAGGFAGRPVYRDTANTAYSGTKPIGRIDARVSPPPAAPGSPSGQVARGGFGGSAVGSSSAS